MGNIDVSVIIVNYNTRNLLFNCLQSIYEKTVDVSYEVIVSDNGSKDDSLEMIKTYYPNIIVLDNKDNIGFGRANNKGVSIAKGKYILYLNSDTVLKNNAIKMFFDYYEKNNIKNDIGALGCNLIDEDNCYTHSYGFFPKFSDCVRELIVTQIKNLIKAFFYLLKFDYKNRNRTENKFIGEVDYITGADLFLLNNNDAKFNECFFLYYEETYLEFKLSTKGLRRILIEGPEIQHLTRGGCRKSFKQQFLSRSFIESYYSMILYFRLQGKKVSVIILACLITILYLNPVLLPKGFSVIKGLWRKVNDRI